MVFRPHVAGLSSLVSISCTCLLSALLFISCSSPSTGHSNASSTAEPRSPHTTPTAPTNFPEATPTVLTSLAPVKTPLAPPPPGLHHQAPTAAQAPRRPGVQFQCEPERGRDDLVLWDLLLECSSPASVECRSEMADDEMGRRSRAELCSASHLAPARRADEDPGLVDRRADSPASSHAGADPEPAHRYSGCRLGTGHPGRSARPIGFRLVGMGTLPRFLRCRLLLPGGELVWRFLAEHHGCRELVHTHETLCISSSSWSQPK
jgi:hypothetical protein